MGKTLPKLNTWVILWACGFSLVYGCASTQSYTEERSLQDGFETTDQQASDAEQVYLERITQDPGDFDAYYNLAVVYERSGKIDRAEEAYRKTLLLEPKHVAAAVNLSGVYRQRGDYRRAIVVLSDLFDTGMDDPRARTDLAVLYRLVGDYDRSLYESSQVLKRFGMVYGAMLNSGLVYLDLGKVEMALTLFLELKNQFPDDSRLHFSIGKAYAALDNPYAAEQEYAKAVSLDENAYEAHNNLGVLRLLKQEWAAAATAFTKAISANVNFATAHMNLGIVYRNLENYEKAAESYKRAVAVRPNYQEAWYNLGLLYDEYWIRPDNALNTWRKYLEQFGSQLGEEQRSDIEARIARIEENREKLRAESEAQRAQPEPEPEPEPATPAPAPVTTPEPVTATPSAESAVTDAQAAPITPPTAPESTDEPQEQPSSTDEGVAGSPDFAAIASRYNQLRQDGGQSPVDPARLIQQMAQKAAELESQSGTPYTFDVRVTEDGKPKLVPVAQ